MNALVHKLGLSQTLSFHDVFSIDDPDLLAFVPRPANALLLVFPVSTTYEKYRMEEDAHRPLYEGKGAQEPVMWYRQTIGNACGLMGLLHAISNGAAKDFVGTASVNGLLLQLLTYAHLEPQSDLAKLIHDAIPLAPTERADLLYSSEVLEHAHQNAASQGQTNAPDAEDNVDLHYVCFVKDQNNNHLWELDGRRKGPLDRGVLDPEDDVLSEKALDLSVRKFLHREQAAPGGELRFSLVTLSPSLD
jgi:ubiquitin carboxyl-terminal hydrolase L3